MQNKKIAHLPEQINITNIKASTLMQNGSKRYSLLSFEHEPKSGHRKEQIIFQTPLFEEAMEIEHYNDYGDYYYVIPNDSEGNKMADFIVELEKHVIQILFKNKENWFPKIDNVTFRSLIKSYTNEQGLECKVIKFKIPYNTKTNLLNVDTIENLDLSTGNREKISVKEIENGLIRMIVNVNAIWLTDNMFGIYLRPIHIEEIRPPIQECDSDFEFQNTAVNNETISKTVNSVSHYIESEMKQNNVIVKKDTTSTDSQPSHPLKKHIGRKMHITNQPLAAEKQSFLPKYKSSKSSKSSRNELTLQLSESDSDYSDSD